jgi:hypothetical protein
MRTEDAKSALERALWSRSAQRERRDDRIMSLAADKQLLKRSRNGWRKRQVTLVVSHKARP